MKDQRAHAHLSYDVDVLLCLIIRHVKKNIEVAVVLNFLSVVALQWTMPRKTRNTRKKKEPSAPSDASKKKLAAIAEDNERESIDSLLEDFEIQSKGFVVGCILIFEDHPTAATLMKQALKQFDKEAKLMMSALPLKSSISKANNTHIISCSYHDSVCCRKY